MKKLLNIVAEIINPTDDYFADNKIKIKKISFTKCNNCNKQYSVNSAIKIANRNDKSMRCPHCYDEV